MAGLSPQVATNFTFQQEAESMTWTVTHNLQRYPVVDVFVLNNSEIERIIPASVTYTNKDTMVITFSTPRSGYVTAV